MGYIYLIREREFLNAEKHIYKVGRTAAYDVRSRLKNYPAESEVIFFMKVENDKSVERAILRSFDERFSRCERIGREYYEGDRYHMIRTIMENEPNTKRILGSDYIHKKTPSFRRMVSFIIPRMRS